MECYGSPDEAARGDIPERYTRVVSVDMAASGDRAIVILEVNPGPQRRKEICACEREEGRWFLADSLGTDHF
jgi:hypothetical protein